MLYHTPLQLNLACRVHIRQGKRYPSTTRQRLSGFPDMNDDSRFTSDNSLEDSARYCRSPRCPRKRLRIIPAYGSSYWHSVLSHRLGKLGYSNRSLRAFVSFQATSTAVAISLCSTGYRNRPIIAYTHCIIFTPNGQQSYFYFFQLFLTLSPAAGFPEPAQAYPLAC
jgi:hypothetical protein